VLEFLLDLAVPDASLPAGADAVNHADEGGG
jgi:hypothetical protein